MTNGNIKTTFGYAFTYKIVAAALLASLKVFPWINETTLYSLNSFFSAPETNQLLDMLATFISQHKIKGKPHICKS